MAKKKIRTTKNRPGGSTNKQKLGGAGHEVGGYVGSHAQARRFRGEHKTARARGVKSNMRATKPAMRQPSRRHMDGKLMVDV